VISLIIPTRNAAARTRDTVKKFLEAARTSDTLLEVIVVDDESRHDERTALREMLDGYAKTVLMQSNVGRGGAINAGALEAAGDLFLIVDCDCPPATADFFHHHLSAIGAGADVSVGALRSRGRDFWSRYQDQAVARRERQFANGMRYAFTSQNVVVKASWFKRIGGFDQSYSRYGFEDRDFFIQLADAGANIVYIPAAGVIHDDTNIRMATIAPKMREAGEFTAPPFRRKHPAAYRALGYAAIDAQLHPWLRPIGIVCGRPIVALARHLDPWLERLPFMLAKGMAKIATALAYLSGTSRKRADR